MRDRLLEEFRTQGKPYRKQIHLEGRFYLRLFDSPAEEPQRLLGFGIIAEREAMRTSSSWEWFVVDRNREYAQNREGASLQIGVERGRPGWEISYTEFLTGVSLEMRKLRAIRCDSPPLWRVCIAKGSHVTWPSGDEIER